MADFNKLYSQSQSVCTGSGLKIKQLKVCIVPWSLTRAGAVIKSGLGGRQAA